MKKYLIILLVCVLVLAAALTAVLLVLRTRGTPADDPGCRYAYTFTEKGKDILVTVKGGESGCMWGVDTASGVNAENAAVKSGAGQTVFQVRAGEPGYGFLTLVLSGADTPIPDSRYALRIAFRADDDGKLSVIGCTHVELTGLVTDSADAAHPYGYCTQPDGSLVVFAEGQAPEADTAAETGGPEEAGKYYASDEWAVLTDSSVLTVRTKPTDTGAVFTVRASGTAGDVVLHLCPPGEDGLSLDLTLRVDESGRITPVSHAWGTVDREKEAGDKRRNEVRNTVGDIPLPDGAVFTDTNTMSLPDGKGNTYSGAWVGFELDGVKWTFLVMPDAPAACIAAYYGVDLTAAADIAVGDAAGQYEETEYGTLVVWATERGSFSVCAAGVTAERAAAAAAEIFTVSAPEA